MSICGGDLNSKINNINAPMWRPIYIKAGSILSFKGCISGSRAYIAFSGSFYLNKTLGSHSIYIHASMGGFQGRTLKKGDLIELNSPTDLGLEIINKLKKQVNEKGFSATLWFVGKNFIPRYTKSPI